MSFVFIYITVLTQAEAASIASAVVSDRLAACANIIPGMTSFYMWEGKLEQRDEVVLVLKTRDTLFEAVEAKVKELHSDTTPCIVALPVAAGNADFLQWVRTETTP